MAIAEGHLCICYRKWGTQEVQVATCQNTVIATMDSCSLSMYYVLQVMLSASHVLGLFFPLPTTA